MASAAEIERLLVTLLGNNKQYLKTLDEAEAATKQFSDNVDRQIRGVAGMFQRAFRTIPPLLRSIGLAGAGFAILKTALERNTNQVVKLQKEAQLLSDTLLDALQPSLDAVALSLRILLAPVNLVIDKFVQLGNVIAKFSPQVRKGLELGRQAEVEAARLDKLIAKREKEIKVERKLEKEQKKRLDALKSRIDSVTKSLREQAATFGMSANQAEIYKLKMAGASEEAIRNAKVAAAFIERKEKEQEALKKTAEAQAQAKREAQANTDRLIAQATAITQEFLTPVERFNQRIEELARLQKLGAITRDTFNRAIAGAGGDLREALKDDEKRRRRRGLSGQDFVNAGSLEAKIRAEEQKDLINSQPRKDKNTILQERIEQHLRAIRAATDRNARAPALTLNPANLTL